VIPLSVRRGLSRARKLALQWARRARLEIRSRTGVQPEAVIYILCVGRSGSSLLDKSLGQQPGVRAHGELLHRVRFNADKENPQRTQRYLRRELLGHPERVHVVKVFQGHLDRSGIDIASLRRFGQRQVFVVLCPATAALTDGSSCVAIPRFNLSKFEERNGSIPRKVAALRSAGAASSNTFSALSTII